MRRPRRRPRGVPLRLAVVTVEDLDEVESDLGLRLFRLVDEQLHGCPGDGAARVRGCSMWRRIPGFGSSPVGAGAPERPSCSWMTTLLLGSVRRFPPGTSGSYAKRVLTCSRSASASTCKPAPTCHPLPAIGGGRVLAFGDARYGRDGAATGQRQTCHWGHPRGLRALSPRSRALVWRVLA